MRVAGDSGLATRGLAGTGASNGLTLTSTGLRSAGFTSATCGATGFDITGRAFTASEVTLATGIATFGGGEGGGRGETVAAGAGPIRSFGKRIPQKPTTGSVNSNST